MKEIRSFFKTKSLKSVVHFILTAHLNSDLPTFQMFNSYHVSRLPYWTAHVHGV